MSTSAVPCLSRSVNGFQCFDPSSSQWQFQVWGWELVDTVGGVHIYGRTLVLLDCRSENLDDGPKFRVETVNGRHPGTRWLSWRDT